MNIANYCEIDPIMPREKLVKRIPIPAIETYTISEFHKDLDSLTKGPKRGVIDCLCKMLSQHGDFSNFSDNYPEAFKRLQDMRK